MASELQCSTLNMNSLRNHQVGENSNMEAQRVMKVRVNRVAIVQVLRVEHVLPFLMKHGVISEEEKKLIKTGSTAQDKTRKLLDLLPEKGRGMDWYGLFKEALKSPDTTRTEIKKKYNILIDFMENTVIPPSQRGSAVGSYQGAPSPADSLDEMKLPKYQPLPSISAASNTVAESLTYEDEEKGMNEAPEHTSDKPETSNNPPQNSVLKSYFVKEIQAPDNFTSLLEEPIDHFKKLQESGEEGDLEQLKQEKIALQRMRNLEGVYALDKRQQLPEEFELCMCKAAQDIFVDRNHHHLYFKYFKEYREHFFMDIIRDIAASFCTFVDSIEDSNDEELEDHIENVGYPLADFLLSFGMYYRSELVLMAITNYMRKKGGLESLMASWECAVKLMAIHNTNLDFTAADWAYNTAQTIANDIKMVSFGQDLLDECEMYNEFSIMMRAQGSIDPAYTNAKAAMMEVEPDNKIGIVNVLCVAAAAYGDRWQVKRAEELAIEAVQQAKELFGTNHPLYIKALVCLCNHSNEFRHDSMGVELARKAVSLAEKVYGGPSILHAEAHQALSKALIVSNNFESDEFYQHALKGWQMIKDLVPGDHPQLATYGYNLANALQWRATKGDASLAQGNLVWAETEAKVSLSIFKTVWGEYSLKRAQGCRLLSTIYAKMERWADAQEQLTDGLNVLRISVPSRSNHMHIMKSTLASFFVQVSKPQQGIPLLQQVVQEVDCHGIYLKWVHLAYDQLIAALKATGKPDDADRYEAALVDWIKKNPKPTEPISWTELDSQPKSYVEFIKGFNIWSNRLGKVKKGLKNLKLQKKSGGPNPFVMTKK